MREPDSWIVGLAVAVAVWFSAIVGFSLGILLVPVSLPAANFAALAVFSILVFFVGRAWGKRTSSKSKVAWGLAATGWLTPWLCVVSGVHGLSEDLGGGVRSIWSRGSGHRCYPSFTDPVGAVESVETEQVRALVTGVLKRGFLVLS